MPFRKLVLTALAALTALLVLCSTASAAPSVTGHFTIPKINSNSKIVAGPDGNMWLGIDEGEFDVAKINPASGSFEKFKLQDIDNPAGIALGPEGKMWVTDTNKVASFSPADPEGSRKVFTINDVTSNTNPIVAGPDGQMWVAASNNIVHFSPADPEGSKGAFPVAGLNPKDIDVAGQLLVVADFAPRIVTMTTSGVEKSYVIGHFNKGLEVQEGTSQGVAGSPTGQIVFSQAGSAPEEVGLITPPNPQQPFDRDGDPFGVAYGSDAAFWVALSGASGNPPAGVERVTSSGEHTYMPVGTPEGFLPRQIAPGPDNTLWLTAENGGTNEYEVVRISGLEPPVPPVISKPTVPPETKISKGPKKTVKTKGKTAKVTFRFSSTTAGAKFECGLVKVKKGKGKKKTPKPKFKGCKSPKKLTLKPGKYRFSVRAVVAGVADPSPATSAFKIVHVR